MPAKSKQFGSRFGVIGSFRNFVNVVREINFEEVRANAELEPRLLVLAPTVTEAEEIGDLLTDSARTSVVVASAFDHMPGSADPFDAVVVFDPAMLDRAARVKSALNAGSLDIPVVTFAGKDTRDAAAADEVRESIVTKAPERAPALGRHIPAFRPAAVEALIAETARANAQFALVSNLPAAIPVIGAFAAAGADMLILTKNQVMLVYKIAASHDRDLRDHWGILREVAPVVGAGFFWRTLAREAASFLPLLIGTLPKVAVAYIGTEVAGRGADFYYRFGRKPTREQMRVIYRQAADAMKKLPVPLTGNSANDAA
jgi:uncharacterized protein (DUF697 family)